MRFDVRARLTVVSAGQSHITGREFVALEFEAVGQPDLGPFFDRYVIANHAGLSLLRRTASRCGVELQHHADVDGCVQDLKTRLGTEVTLDVETRRLREDGREYWNVRQVR